MRPHPRYLLPLLLGLSVAPTVAFAASISIEGATHWTFPTSNRPNHFGSFGSTARPIVTFSHQNPGFATKRSPIHRPRPLPGGHPALSRPPRGSTIVLINNTTFYCFGNRYYWPFVYRGQTWFQPVYPPQYDSGRNTVLYVPPQPAEQTSPSTSERTPSQSAQSTVNTASPDAETPDLDPRALRILKNASDYHSGLKTFIFETTETVIEGKDSSNTITQTRQTLVQRPNKLTSRILDSSESGSEAKGFWFNGDQLAWFDFQTRVWSKLPITGDIDDLIAALRSDFGMNIPVADLLSRNIYTAIAPDLTAAAVKPRTQQIGDSLCHELVLSNLSATATFWVDTDPDRPIVRQIQIRYHDYEGLTYTSTIQRLRPLDAVDPTRFDFDPPTDGVEVTMLTTP